MVVVLKLVSCQFTAVHGLGRCLDEDRHVAGRCRSDLPIQHASTYEPVEGVGLEAPTEQSGTKNQHRPQSRWEAQNPGAEQGLRGEMLVYIIAR